RSCSLCRYCASPPPLVPADPLVKREMKYVLVTGGVVSGLGKGVTASSIGVVLKACGLRVTSIKIGLSVLNAISRVPGIQKALSVVCFTKQAFVPKWCVDAGDIESMPFIEALGQFSYRVGEDAVRIAMVGKYTGLSDSYLSVLKVKYMHHFLSTYLFPFYSGHVKE
ncbi:hypothetical protein GW17_00034309, partial [Ensete ventricosum]